MNNTLTVLVGGIPISSNLSESNGTFITDGVSVETDEAGVVFASFPDEITVQVELVAGIPNIVVSLDERFMNGTLGLLGTFNGNEMDDFTYLNDTVISPNSTDREIHYWGQSC